MWFIAVEVEQETNAPPPKKNPGTALVYVGVNNRIITMIHLPSITYIFRYHVRRWNV